jgi:ribose transport system substrate-binding protein
MKFKTGIFRFAGASAAVAAGLIFGGGAARAAGPELVSGPSAEPGCLAPWTAQTKFFKYPARKGPFRIALANGYIANT